MGKPFEPNSSRPNLRCVHCRTSETPLWRTGPDGAKTLCNACGVRFKKGKLALYRNASGALTAIKQADAAPVVVPPAPKKSQKKSTVVAATAAAVAAAAAAAAAPASASLPKASTKGGNGVFGGSSHPQSRHRTSTALERPRSSGGRLLSLDESAAPHHGPRKGGRRAGANYSVEKPLMAKNTPGANTNVEGSTIVLSTTQGATSSARVLDNPSGRHSSHVKKVPSDPAITATLAKRVRTRVRRMNAGQMPGRYYAASRAASIADADVDHMHDPLPSPSPPSLLRSAPSSPGMHDHYAAEDDFILRGSLPVFNVHEPTPYQFKDTALDDVFPDVACLGLDGGDGKDCGQPLMLPLMDADPSSAEHFSFPEQTGFAADAAFVMDPPNQRTALIGLVRDRSRQPGRLYHACVRALSQLAQRLVIKGALSSCPSAPERRHFVRNFAADHNNAIGVFMVPSDSNGKSFLSSSAGTLFGFGEVRGPSAGFAAARIMLPDRATYDTAVDAFQAMCDCGELAIFSDDVVYQVLEDDVAIMIESPSLLASEEQPGACGAGVVVSTESMHSKHVVARG